MHQIVDQAERIAFSPEKPAFLLKIPKASAGLVVAITREHAVPSGELDFHDGAPFALAASSCSTCWVISRSMPAL
jgi:hypothetical protein